MELIIKKLMGREGQQYLVEKCMFCCGTFFPFYFFLAVMGFVLRETCLLGVLPPEPQLQPFLLW
jgi:hypothetical protein